MRVNGKQYRTVWLEGSTVRMINQLLLPHSFKIYSAKNYRETANAIRTMVVRGAGAIGATAGFAMAQAVLGAKKGNYKKYIEDALRTIKSTRPTAQNLFYAVDRVYSLIKDEKNLSMAKKLAVDTANAIADEDADACKKIGESGEKLIKDNCSILTHCNAGWLAFVDYGSALSPVYMAARNNKKVFVYVDETRPRCQGSKLTSWELNNEKIPNAIIADNAAGFYMQQGKIDLVITGADRIAANGDTANKIGTYEKAVLAKENNIPFYIAAPSSTIDIKTKTGKDIPIEERPEDEVLYMGGIDEKNREIRVRIAPNSSKAKNPAFDVTPAKYIRGIITEKGIIKADEDAIRALF